MDAYNDGWSDFPDVRDYLVLDPGETGAMGAVGAHFANGYGRRIGQVMPPCTQRTSPAEVQGYAIKLQDLGYDAPNTGDACNGQFRAAVYKFQEDNQPGAGEIDGLIGPQTKATIDRAVMIHGGDLPPPPIPNIPPPPVPPGPGPGPGPISPVSAKKKDNTLLYVGAGLVGVTVLGLTIWAFSK